MSGREITPEEADDHYSEYGDCTQQDVWIAQKVERETARREREGQASE